MNNLLNGVSIIFKVLTWTPKPAQLNHEILGHLGPLFIEGTDVGMRHLVGSLLQK